MCITQCVIPKHSCSALELQSPQSWELWIADESTHHKYLAYIVLQWIQQIHPKFWHILYCVSPSTLEGSTQTHLWSTIGTTTGQPMTTTNSRTTSWANIQSKNISRSCVSSKVSPTHLINTFSASHCLPFQMEPSSGRLERCRSTATAVWYKERASVDYSPLPPHSPIW